MLKPVAVATLVAFGTFAIIVGCDAPSTDGGVKKGSSADDDDDDNNAKPKGTSSSTSSGGNEIQADCTGLPPADKVPACDTCAKSKCCNELAACENSNQCKLQKKCIEDCAEGDFACLLTCQGQFEEGSELAGDFAGCLQLNCKDECKASEPNLDGGLDPFGDL